MKKEWLGKDGLNHGVIGVAIGAGIVYAVFYRFGIGFALFAAVANLIIQTYVWYRIERKQARAMNQGDNWRKWSTARHRDMAWPLFFNLVIVALVLIRWSAP